MSFERGKDPIKTMEIGRTKDAISVIKVKYWINDNEFSITEDFLIAQFLEDLQKLTILKNPVFGPQRIKIITQEKREEPDIFSAFTMRGRSSSSRMITKIVDIELGIDSYAGKTLEYKNKLYAAPSIKDLNQNGYGYLEIMEKRAKEKKEIEDNQRIDHLHNMMTRQKAMMKFQFQSNLKDFPIIKTIGGEA